MPHSQPDLPPSLASRPRSTSGLPIPYVAARRSDGSPDFALVDPLRSLAAAQQRRCAVCGTKMGYWVAFIGGPKSVSTRTFVDGPAHEDCLVAAIGLCPYLAHRATRRSDRVQQEATTPAGFDDGKPSQFQVGITRQYRTVLGPNGEVLHRAAPFKRVRRFGYRTGSLAEVADAEDGTTDS